MQHVLKLWLVCLKQYVQMSLFQSSPAKLPYNQNTIALTLLAYCTVGYILLGGQRSLISIIAQIAIEVGILSAICFLVLKIIKKPERLLQTLSALIGVNLVVSIVSIPIFHFLPLPVADEQVNPLTLQVNVVLLVWNLAIISLILKRALELSIMLAGFLAFNYFLLYEFILLNTF